MGSHLDEPSHLLFQVEGAVGALPLPIVLEIMRPQPLTAVAADLPHFVEGLSLIRGKPTPVVHVGKLLASPESAVNRLILLRLARGQVALAVTAVIGVQNLQKQQLLDVPPLLSKTDPACLEALGSLDQELLLLFQGSHIISEQAWAALEKHETLS